MIRSSVDLPQPEGPISETNSPGCTSRSIRSSASTSPRSKRFERPVIETAAAVVAHATCSGARRTSSRSAIATTEKKRIPSPAAMMFVAQRLSGEVM